LTLLFHETEALKGHATDGGAVLEIQVGHLEKLAFLGSTT
jgi:hypothetical protein